MKRAMYAMKPPVRAMPLRRIFFASLLALFVLLHGLEILFPNALPWAVCTPLAIGALGYAYISRILRLNAFIRQSQAAALQGDFEKAQVLLDRMDKMASGWGKDSVLLATRGFVSLVEGDLENGKLILKEGIARLGATSVSRKVQFEKTLVHNLCLCELLEGDLAAAGIQLERSRRLRGASEGYLAVLEQLTLLRGGKYEQVAITPNEKWSLWDATLAPHSVRHMRLFRALAYHRRDASKHAARINELLGGAKPFRPGEYDFLCGEWPELREMLVEYGFVTESAAASKIA